MRPRRATVVVWAMIAAVTCFIASTLYTKHLTAGISRETESVLGNIVPSVAELSAARSEVALLRARGDGTDPGQRATVLAARQRLGEHIDAYLRTPWEQGEPELYQQVARALADADEAYVASDRERRLAALDRAQQGIDRLVSFHVRWLDLRGRAIDRTWRRSATIEFALDGMSLLIAGGAAALAVRRIRRQQRELEERSRELEMFAGRVAHDVLSPLQTMALTVPVLRSRLAGDQEAGELAARAMSSLGRVRTIVDGLLAFARSGARPDASAATDVQPVIAGVLDELGPQAAERAITLTLLPSDSARVATSAGVLTSVVSNLVRNAIKHMGDRLEREVTVEVHGYARHVRVEVQDTGPGLPPGLDEAQAFLPYVRGRNAAVPGIGLGLATVERLVTASGGSVGVHSRPGEGCTFWFELPRAATPTTLA